MSRMKTTAGGSVARSTNIWTEGSYTSNFLSEERKAEVSRIYYLGVGLLLCWVLVLIALVLVTDGMNALTVDQNKMALTYMTLALLVSLNITLFGLQRSRKGEQE